MQEDLFEELLKELKSHLKTSDTTNNDYFIINPPALKKFANKMSINIIINAKFEPVIKNVTITGKGLSIMSNFTKRQISSMIKIAYGSNMPIEFYQYEKPLR
jgi:hypothetical protein